MNMRLTVMLMLSKKNALRMMDHFLRQMCLYE
jgi:hypothetical protein